MSQQPPITPDPIGPPPPSYGYAAYPMPPAPEFPAPEFPAQPSRAKAIWALVLSILPVPLAWIAAVVLAILVLVGAREGKERGRGLAITALVVVGLWVLGTVALVAAVTLASSGSTTAARPPTSTGSSAGDVNLNDLRVGDCTGVIPNQDQVLTVPVQKCAAPHHGEVFGVFDLAVATDAKQAEIDRLSEGGCTRRFKDYVGIGYDLSAFDFDYFSPNEGGLADDRSVLCILSDSHRPITGSVKGTQR